MSIEKRLNQLERQNKRMKKGMIGMVLAGLSMLVMAQATSPKVHNLIRARQIEIVSKAGKSNLFMTTTKTGNPIIVGLTPKGNEVYGMGVDDKGHGTISTNNSSGKKIFSATATTAGDGAISTYDTKGKNLIVITSRTNGEGIIVQYNRSGSPSSIWPQRR
jgi:hypothetical protein